MVEQRANLDYGADDTSVTDDLTHTPAVDADDALTDRAEYVVVDEEADDADEGDEVNPEASTYGAP